MSHEQEAATLKSDMIVKHPLFLEEAFTQKKEPLDVFVAGGTLLQVHWESGSPIPKTLINLSLLQDLKGISYQDLGASTKIIIGALTTIAECITHPVLVEHAPLLVMACRNIAAPAVRNRATVGGNIASFVGDTIPALLVLNTEVKLAVKEEIHVMTLWEWLANENQSPFILLEIMIPISPKDTKHFYRKVGRREAFIPSILTISGQWQQNNDGKLQFVRIAVGGGNHRPIRLKNVELLLQEGITNKETFYKTILHEFQSYSDPFVSEAYRKKVAANILMTELANILDEEGKDGAK